VALIVTYINHLPLLMDTLCIPNNYSNKRKEAINLIERIYTRAAAVLVLDPVLSSISYNQLEERWRTTRVNMLVEASP
jgi:hypothetical protein